MAVLMRVYDATTAALLVELPLFDSLNLTYGINMSLQFSSSLPENWPKRDLIEVGQPVEVFLEKTRLLSGILQRLEPSLDFTTHFSGVGTMDTMYDEKIFPLAYYNNKPVLGILVELLLQAGWILGEIGTLETPDQVTTIDLRNESNLLTQINKLLSGMPQVFYREGDTILGYPSLDIGSFLEDSGIAALSPGAVSTNPEDNPNVHWVDSLRYQEDNSAIVYAVKALGGNVKDSLGESRVINLGDAVANDINLLYDSDFPIIEDLAERNWLTLNYRDFGRVGGRILSTVDGTSDSYIGDNQGGGVNENIWALHTFVPFPGILESFSLWFGNVAANTVGFNITWVLQEIDSSDYVTVIADNLLTGTFTTTGLDNTIHKVIPDTEYELVRGKLYGIAFGFNFDPVPDTFTVRVKRRLTSVSPTFRYQSRNGKAGVGQTWNAGNHLGYLELITRAIDSPLGGIVGETASKYAPKSSGANATLAETKAAGAALYIWSKAYLSDHVPGIKNYNLSAIGNRNFPKPGDTLYVNSKARGQYIDPLTGRIIPTIREVEEDLRINRVQADINGEAVSVNYDLTLGTGVLNTDLIVSLYDKTENDAPAQGDAAARPWTLLLDTLTTVIGPVSPDTTLEDGTLAVTVSLSIFSGSYAIRPNDVEEVYLAGLPYGTISPGGELRVEMVQLQTISNAAVIFKIALKTRNWEYGDVATITVKQVWR